MQHPIVENLRIVRERIAAACVACRRDAAQVQILAVTKTHPTALMLDAARAGLLDLAENRVQEALPKLAELRAAVAAGALPAALRPRVHLIGRLQANKVNKAVGAFASIASVDRLELLQQLARRASSLGLVQDIWIQVNISRESQKGGCPPELTAALWAAALAEAPLAPLGLMTVGRLDAPEAEARAGFALLRGLAEPLLRRDGSPAGLSMGMSDDFEWAVLEGSTQVRLGSVLFGPRAQVVPDS